MTAEKLKQLETSLAENEEFQETFKFFMDHFADHRIFIEQSKKVKLPFLNTLVKEAARFFLRKDQLVLVGFRVTESARLNIYHGSATTEGHHLVFFYCKRINQGMLVFFGGGSGMMDYLRITPRSVDGSKMPENFAEIVEDMHEKRAKPPIEKHPFSAN